MKAAARGHSDCARNLLGHIARGGIRDKKGQTALLHAVINGEAAFLRDMIELKNSVVGTSDLSFRTSIFLDPEQVPWRDTDGKTVIQRAEELGHRQIADLLRRYLDELIERNTEQIAKGGSGAWIFYRHRAFAYQTRGDQEKADADFRQAKQLGDPN
jgi:ankyrin repeat protein